ncbi:hypothetical protein CMK11_20825 [Candidatus Poribacteria bacterium]|nr:hypothetical protein [Candidatus Poribacteria bacterium]
MSNVNRGVRVGLFALALTLLSASDGVAQFDVAAYEQFLAANQGLSADGLLSQYPADTFLDSAGSAGIDAAYGDQIDAHYLLTDGEKSAILRNGFVVSERLTYDSFGDALIDIFHADLPVYVSADSILHAMHASYDSILMATEITALIPALMDLTTRLRQHIPSLDARYADEPGMARTLRDLDVYITVGHRMLSDAAEPIYPENGQTVDELVALIAAEAPRSYPLFADADRLIDFSQFRPRGHYAGPDVWTRPGSATLAQYFRAMMWFGRTEVYLSAPNAAGAQGLEEDIQRQTILAVLTMELIEAAGAETLLADIESTIRTVAGPSDNVTPDDLQALVAETGIADASALLEAPTWKAFQATLLEQPYASQRILSQILYSPPGGEKIEPASAFLLFGQRFIIDSFITGNVVYDKVPSRRMLPSSLDVLFALGNDAAAQLLVPELRQYNYAGNLASLRYLVDDYQTETWDDSLYAGWLNSIRALNPPGDRSRLPTFMQTAAWWQKTMTTQLASWAELRHDHLLYAKQSYSGGIVCSFPRSFVEPVPEFYDAVARFARNASAGFGNAPLGEGWLLQAAIDYFGHLADTTEQLSVIARKELDDIALSPDEQTFLAGMLRDPTPGCGATFGGWYPRLYYTALGGGEAFRARDLVVADVHTSPTDASGNPVGWVMHAGTGPVNLAVLVCDFDREDQHVVVGPVSSYYERITVNFNRLTDQEWDTEYAATPSYRPEFVDLYLANAAGDTAPEAVALFMREGPPPAAVEARGKLLLPLARVKQTALLQNFPNPFNPETWIPFELGAAADVTITIYE